MAIYALGERVPRIDPSAFVHPDAVVIGDVVLGAESSVWPCAVLRGDYGRIEIGDRTSIQDGSVLHARHDLPTVVGSDCVVGHLVHLEGCTIEPHVLIGSGACVLHRAVVRSHSLVGANAVVPDRMEVPSFAMALGVPATIRENAAREGFTAMAVAAYVGNAKRYGKDLRRLD